MSESLFKNQVLPHIQAIQAYQPGKPISECQREYQLNRITKLASNENPLGASEKAIEAIQSSLVDIGRYPDGASFVLKNTLADFLQRTPQEIALGNGSNELLELVARVFAGEGDEILFSEYAFPVYEISAQVVGATGVKVPAKNWGHDLTAMADAITDRTKVIYLANPNNPTGTLFREDEWRDFIAKVPSHVIVVLDEAYFEYVRDPMYANGLDYLDDYPNLLVSRTFSKAYGLASLRLGYMVGSSELIGYLNQIRAPFNVNQIAQVAATAALADREFVEKTIRLNHAGMQQLTDHFSEVGLDYIESQSNFICVHLGPKSSQINQALLEKGVIVRPVAKQGAFSEYLRVSIGLEQENAHFIQALSELL
ncbi:histidinol-phosphate transaminase [Hydrogenovibrio sp. SC-1]|uniref:histidinol-phosphate transaminase n=1 Tax=Hydrogenovibrio sp. SC-1 TaxID=2065820 RepID=UPI000C7A8B83|nr:histidinol-phosphate transaminase [Hydrogenovibrio sp. SC-1]PLA73660.1 histidinol-phosphate transaminase [Hydrogenovibrio sp. SC-1]